MDLLKRIREAYDNGVNEREIRVQRLAYACISLGSIGESIHDSSEREREAIEQKLKGVPKPSNFLERLAYSLGKLS